jgi:hypothetical protein
LRDDLGRRAVDEGEHAVEVDVAGDDLGVRLEDVGDLSGSSATVLSTGIVVVGEAGDAAALVGIAVVLADRTTTSRRPTYLANAPEWTSTVEWMPSGWGMILGGLVTMCRWPPRIRSTPSSGSASFSS